MGKRKKERLSGGDFLKAADAGPESCLDTGTFSIKKKGAAWDKVGVSLFRREPVDEEGVALPVGLKNH